MAFKLPALVSSSSSTGPGPFPHLAMPPQARLQRARHVPCVCHALDGNQNGDSPFSRNGSGLASTSNSNGNGSQPKYTFTEEQPSPEVLEMAAAKGIDWDMSGLPYMSNDARVRPAPSCSSSCARKAFEFTALCGPITSKVSHQQAVVTAAQSMVMVMVSACPDAW